MKPPVYLDHNATTPVDPRVFEAMLPYMKEKFGNPSSSSHSYGWIAEDAVQTARKQVANLIGCHPKEVIFTSGATESNNLALFGYLQKFLKQHQKPHIITTQTEHKAVQQVCKNCESWGAEVTYLNVNSYGEVNIEELKEAIRPNTKLISVIFAQNEIGTINPIEEIAQVAKDNKIIFHTDAAQATGKVDFSVKNLGVDLLSISAHKLYGPKGTGALYINFENPDLIIDPVVYGGTQEGGIRPGTLNVSGIVGLGKACELAQEFLKDENEKIKQLRDYLIEKILKAVPQAQLNGHPTKRLCGNASFSFKNLSPSAFAGVQDIAISSSSACSSACAEPSSTLKAIGHTDELARATLRFGIGRFNSAEEIDYACNKVIEIANKNMRPT